jgi:hypothetical protein
MTVEEFNERLEQPIAAALDAGPDHNDTGKKVPDK